VLKTIGDKEPSFANRMKKTIKQRKKKDKEIGAELKLDKIIAFFSEKTASVEILNESKRLQKVYFPIHNVTKFLSDYSRVKFMENVNRESSNDKINDMLEMYLDFYDEMTHFQKLRAFGIPVNLTYFEWLKNISLICVVAANVIMLITSTSTDPKFSDKIEDRIVLILGFIIMVIYLVIGALWVLFNSKIDILKTQRKLDDKLKYIQQIDSHVKRSLQMFGYFRTFFFTLLFNSYMLDLIMNITFAMLGVYYSKLFFSFMLLDFIGRSETLKNIIKAVTESLGQFLMTGLLGIILLFNFTTITYYTRLQELMPFAENKDFKWCTDYLHCYLTMLG
jgi:hypothetical protein